MPCQQFCHNTTNGPYVHRLIVVHPIKHNFGGSVPPGGNVASHFGFCWPRQAEIQNFQFAVFVDGNIGRFQILIKEEIDRTQK